MFVQLTVPTIKEETGTRSLPWYVVAGKHMKQAARMFEKAHSWVTCPQGGGCATREGGCLPRR